MRGTESHKHITADLFSKPSYRHHHHQHHHKLARAPLNRWPAAPYVQHTVQKIKYIKWNWIKEKMNVTVESVQNSEQVSFFKDDGKTQSASQCSGYKLEVNFGKKSYPRSVSARPTSPSVDVPACPVECWVSVRVLRHSGVNHVFSEAERRCHAAAAVTAPSRNA